MREGGAEDEEEGVGVESVEEGEGEVEVRQREEGDSEVEENRKGEVVDDAGERRGVGEGETGGKGKCASRKSRVEE
jgi:hypothetical protein